MQPRLEDYGQYQQQPPPQQPQQPQQAQRPSQRILYMTRRPEQRPAPVQEPIVVIIDDRTLQIFVRSVYAYALIFILVTSITWLAISGADVEFTEAVPVPYFVWLILAFVFMMIMNCIPQIRYCFPLNWVFAILIVIMIIFAGCCVMNLFKVQYVLAGLLIAIAIVAVFYACGALCPQKVLPGVLCTACLSCILCITLLVFLILIIFLRNPIIGLVFGILLFCMVIVMMPFQAQFIHGRLEIVPLFDMLHCSLTVYIHFVMVFYAIGYFYFYNDETRKR